MSKKNKIVKKDNNKNTFKIILLGDAGTGKTSLINAFFNKDSKWNKLLNEAYLYMNTDKYDSICKEIYDFAENEYN